MKVFNVYAKEENQIEPILVEEGFCIWGFILGPAWALYNRMWLVGLLSICLYVLANFIETNLSVFFGQMLNNLFLLLYGFFGYDILCYRLSQQNYLLQDVVMASDAEEAELKYLSKIK